MRILTNIMAFVLGLFIAFVVVNSYAGDTMLACQQTDGTTLYTNKEVKGCKVIVGPALSIVPSYQSHTQHDQTKAVRIPQVPTLTMPDNVQSEVVSKTCALYKEWVLINERTKGGFEYNDVDDTKKRLYLTKIFGSGFSPTMCKE